jgi:hypothetical protein
MFLRATVEGESVKYEEQWNDVVRSEGMRDGSWYKNILKYNFCR